MSYRPRPLGGVVLAMTLGAPAVGAQAAESFSLAWTRGDGAAACLSQSELQARVRSRLGRDPFVPAGERTIEGHVVRTAEGYDAELSVRTTTDQVLGQRRVSTPGDDCSALGGAVTLAIVLTIDPNAPLDPNQGSASFPMDAPPPAPPPPPEPPPACVEDPVADRPAAPCPPPKPERPIPGTLLAAAGAVGPLPRLAPGVALDVTLPTLPIAPVFGARILVPVTTGDGHLQVGLDTLGLGLCGRAFTSSPVSLDTCAGGEGGVTTVVARDLTPVNPGLYPWFAVSGGVRVVVRTGSLTRFQAGAVALVPLIRQQFQVDSPGAQGFQASAVGGLFFAGAELGGT